MSLTFLPCSVAGPWVSKPLADSGSLAAGGPSTASFAKRRPQHGAWIIGAETSPCLPRIADTRPAFALHCNAEDTKMKAAAAWRLESLGMPQASRESYQRRHRNSTCSASDISSDIVSMRDCIIINMHLSIENTLTGSDPKQERKQQNLSVSSLCTLTSPCMHIYIMTRLT